MRGSFGRKPIWRLHAGEFFAPDCIAAAGGYKRSRTTSFAACSAKGRVACSKFARASSRVQGAKAAAIGEDVFEVMPDRLRLIPRLLRLPNTQVTLDNGASDPSPGVVGEAPSQHKLAQSLWGSAGVSPVVGSAHASLSAASLASAADCGNDCIATPERHGGHGGSVLTLQPALVVAQLRNRCVTPAALAPEYLGLPDEPQVQPEQLDARVGPQ
eukprot:CAMPEP_0180580902 /NCGR_PEP_ID=MMETSP1037_2-20121125/13772_1 /TAXON_ID=632150 /ORGANISM="Azadinium spinosum, Strain 3D9" /LENGTH=213 /DNA_ID=CAMNT_0022598861 /DNA_START=163 /DNA_END=801 /DNA_ORIENTATION=+